ncbi:MAG: methyl-accepting chemotaxis protein [Lachnospiraceae bacterium]|nr:methyl-accepting chemotaxis protein [Lachnospiraceae bacterium]
MAKIKKDGKKLTSFHSILVQICIVSFISVMITGVFMMWMYSSNVKKEITGMAQHYINDLAIAYGTTLDNEIKKADGDATYVMKADNLYLKLNGVGIEGVDSSYVYVVDASGQMLFHPDDSKIGHSVENAVVKQCIADLEAGKKVENGVVEYEFKGALKYAGVYVSTYEEFILVVSSDEDDILSPITKINRMGNIALVVIIFVTGGLGYVFASRIAKPIIKMTELTVGLSEMDFTDKPEYQQIVKRKDEVGSMGRALTQLRVELVNTVEQIRNQSSLLLATSADLSVSAAETSTTMEQLESAVNEIAEGATSQAAETQRATENVVVMGNMVEEADQQVAELIEYAEQMRKAGNGATEILNQLAEVNGQTERYIDIIAEQTATTNESAQKIHEAADMITDIAEETNLLSLNASIEAARAGEQGRGFAVVAAQIQKLAEQSNESAQQIGEIIRTLMDDSQKAVTIMGDVKAIMLKQSEHVERTKDAFTEIQNGVDQSIRGMEVISEKTQEMDRARKGVIDVVQELSAIAEENAASTEETSASVTEVSAISSELSDEAVRLKDISNTMEERMSVFKI